MRGALGTRLDAMVICISSELIFRFPFFALTWSAQKQC